MQRLRCVAQNYAWGRRAAEGSAAKLWCELCTELRVGSAAARKWWRWLVEAHSSPLAHCFDVGWMRSVAAEVSTSSAGGLFASLLRTQGARSFHGGAALCAKAKDKASAGGGGGGGGGGHGEGGMSSTHCTGLNYKKGGSDPELGPDEAYPDWLWKLAEPKKTLTELEKEVAAAKLTGRYDVMDVKDVKRLLKLRRRAKIKANNASRAK